MSRRKLVYVPLDEIEPAEQNPKGHSPQTISASIDRFGYVEPMIIDDRTGRLVAGHGRREQLVALRDQGAPAPAGVVVEKGVWRAPVVHGWSSTDDDEALALGIALNRTTELGGWETRDLATILEVLEERDPSFLDAVGFDRPDIDELLAEIRADDLVGQGRPPASDEVPEPPAEPDTKPGDVWLLGDHRLLCGDARLVADYERVLAGEHLSGAVVADPPYGVAIGAKNRALDSIDRAGRVLTDLDGDQGIEEVEKLWRASFGALHQVMPPGLPYYIFGPQGGDLGLLLLLLRDAGLSPRHILIWVKNRPSFSIGRLDYDYQHEPIVYGWQPGGPHHWHADSPRTSILAFDRPQASPDHPTTKPLALIAHLVLNSTKPDDIVCDPFGGSGTTLMACEQEGRRARLLEIDPRYCDVICTRYQRHTGTVPILETTGEPHSFVDSAP